MNKKVLVPIADGSEEIETACIVDTLRRADAEVTVASVSTEITVTMSRNMKFQADKFITECNEEYDLIVLPGGMPGAENLKNSQKLTELLQKQKNSGKLYAAICASPAIVLQHHNLLEGKKATCYPAFMDKLTNPSNEPVLVDGNCITSQGPGTAISFALELVNLLFGRQKAQKRAEAMLVEF